MFGDFDKDNPMAESEVLNFNGLEKRRDNAEFRNCKIPAFFVWNRTGCLP